MGEPSLQRAIEQALVAVDAKQQELRELISNQSMAVRTLHLATVAAAKLHESRGVLEQVRLSKSDGPATQEAMSTLGAYADEVEILRLNPAEAEGGLRRIIDLSEGLLSEGIRAIVVSPDYVPPRKFP